MTGFDLKDIRSASDVNPNIKESLNDSLNGTLSSDNPLRNSNLFNHLNDTSMK